MHRRWTVANGVMLSAFALSVVVQLNDPDPFLWIGIWGAAATACALELMGRGGVGFPAAVGIITLGYALQLAPGVLGAVPFGAMFQAWEMADTGIEESREFYGLIWITTWMLALMWRARRRTSRAAG